MSLNHFPAGSEKTISSAGSSRLPTAPGENIPINPMGKISINFNEVKLSPDDNLRQLFKGELHRPKSTFFKRYSRQYESEPNRDEKRGKGCRYNSLLDAFPNRFGDPQNANVAEYLMMHDRVKGRQFATSIRRFC